MKRRFLLFLMMILLLAALAGSASPAGKVNANGGAEIRKFVFASGGDSSEFGDVQINATFGQAVVDSTQEGDTTLTSGFWIKVLEVVQEFLNFLPAIFH